LQQAAVSEQQAALFALQQLAEPAFAPAKTNAGTRIRPANNKSIIIIFFI
jgi:hypothetical protein